MIATIARSEVEFDEIHEHGHVFWPAAMLGLTQRVLKGAHVCRQCGIVRISTGQNKPCRGAVRVALRGDLA